MNNIVYLFQPMGPCFDATTVLRQDAQSLDLRMLQMENQKSEQPEKEPKPEREPYEPPKATLVALKIEERLMACGKRRRCSERRRS
jgi:hypothetical protein